MNSVNKTLYIPLYGKSYVSKKSLFLDDKKAIIPIFSYQYYGFFIRVIYEKDTKS